MNSTVAESDAALVLAAVAGDRAAFGLLLSRHRPALVRLCLRLTSEPGTAEDCAQDACLWRICGWIVCDRQNRLERG